VALSDRVQRTNIVNLIYLAILYYIL